MLYSVDTLLKVHGVFPLYIFIIIYDKIKYICSILIDNILVLFTIRL
uniref:Uncharacterized protein n=1 Tax=Podoviridae sp. ctG4L18 TaxID=2825234 RepID=A0A8S5UP50_9CAUD|nr:MAG TPA: hypothetical protein [Podoviridae sp. ctG4L18]